MCRTCFNTNDLPRYFDRLAREDKIPSLDELEKKASKLFKTYSTTAAHWNAVRPGNRTTDLLFPLGDPCVQLEAHMHQNPPFAGDWALGNSILLMCDGIWLLEVCQAVTSGDIGRVWEVLKVIEIGNVLCKMANRRSPISRYGY